MALPIQEAQVDQRPKKWYIERPGTAIRMLDISEETTAFN